MHSEAISCITMQYCERKIQPEGRKGSGRKMPMFCVVYGCFNCYIQEKGKRVLSSLKDCYSYTKVRNIESS